MATPAVTPQPASVGPSTTVAPVKAESGFERFIDKIKGIFVKAEPLVNEINQVAQEAEPLLALSPIGPEYAVVVNAIVGAQTVAQASIAAGTTLTGTQKFALAVQAATPALTTILASKGVTTQTQTHIANWVQTVFNILSGPVATIANTVTAAKP